MGWGLKRIPTKPKRRLSPSAPGKGELEGSGLRLAKRNSLLQSCCQNYIHYITSAWRMGVRTGAESRRLVMLYRKSIRGVLVTCLGSFLEEKF